MSEVKLTDAELAALERISAAHRESTQGEWVQKGCDRIETSDREHVVVLDGGMRVGDQSFIATAHNDWPVIEQLIRRMVG